MLLSYVQLFHDLESKKFDPESKKFGNYLDSGFELQGPDLKSTPTTSLQGPDLKSAPTTSLQGTEYCRQEVVGVSSAAVHDASSLQKPDPLKTHVVR